MVEFSLSYFMQPIKFFSVPQLIPTLHPIKKATMLTIVSHQVASLKRAIYSSKNDQTAFATGIFHFIHLVLYIPPTRYGGVFGMPSIIKA